MRTDAASKIEVFEYVSSASAAPVLWEVMEEIATSAPERRDDGSRETTGAAKAEDAEQLFAAGREQGIHEASALAAQAQQMLLQEENRKRVEQAVHLAGQLAAERDRFLVTAEREVVKLALAIAARILRREAEVDPLFLIGAVRVALGQLAETVQVKLRIPAEEAELWAETIAHLTNLKVIPSVIADNRMHLGECLLESEMGSVDLGLSAQLREVDRSLFQRHSTQGNKGKTSDAQCETEA